MNIEVKKGLLNLHDAFLNAALPEREKWRAPIEEDPEKFHMSDHGRLERMWVTLLYVLVEAWESAQMAPVRTYVESVTPIIELTSLLRAGKADGSLRKMRHSRDYMCHRDRREILGRWSVGGLRSTRVPREIAGGLLSNFAGGDEVERERI